MSTTPQPRAYRVAVVTDQAPLEHLVREILSTMMPSLSVERLPLAGVAAADVDVLVLDENTSGLNGASAVQEARARGYRGMIVLFAFPARPASDDEAPSLEQELRRIRQLVAMGEATSHIQHTLNNPLTALLAEAQLLEMEELADDHRAAVKRIIELCRRLVGMVRTLDPGPR